jgi:hypothetical protein
MLKDKCENWTADLKASLREITKRELNPAGRLSASVAVIRATLGTMRQYIEEHPFEGPSEEIRFFKYGKPGCYALLILAFKEFHIEQSKPVGTAEQLRSYYLQELELIRRFFAHHAFLYSYYRNGLTELDEHYFLRGRGLKSTVLPCFPDHDQLFSTAADYLFSKFMALEQVQEDLLGKIKDTDPEVVVGHVRKVRSLRWTGESINLVELGYGLFDTGQFNDGKAGIGEIFSWLKENLQVSIGIPARRFVEISRRRRLSRTKFLDQLRDAVNRKADEGDAFVPGKGNRKWD